MPTPSPRATGDIDIWIRPSESNAQRVWNALRAFRAPISKISLSDFTQPDIVFQIGVAPRRIDILTSVSGIEFEEAWSERLTAVIDGLRLQFLNRKHLIINKRASGRPKDLADLAWLESGTIAKEEP